MTGPAIWRSALHHMFRTAVLAGAAALGLATVAGGLYAQAPQRTPAGPVIAAALGGRESFNRYCASCHGTTGKGDGPVADALRTRPADLTTLAQRNNGAYPRDRVQRVITGGGAATVHGKSDMPVWGEIFGQLEPSDARARTRIDNLVQYVATLQAPTTLPQDAGAKLFTTYCASCHGRTGKGDGPLAGDLRRRPADLTQFTARNGGVFPRDRVYRIIDGRDIAAHGDPAMPVWGDAFSRSREGLTQAEVRERIDAIVRFLQAIQQRAA